jgi:hypothetical protein
VTAASTGRTGDQVQSSIEAIRPELIKNAAIARYVGDGFPAQVAKVYREVTGAALPDKRAEEQALQQHQSWHAHPHVEAATSGH